MDTGYKQIKTDTNSRIIDGYWILVDTTDVCMLTQNCTECTLGYTLLILT